MAPLKLNTKNYGRICGLNGLKPSEVPSKIGKHRDTIYRALRTPHHFAPTIELLEKALPIREVPRG